MGINHKESYNEIMSDMGVLGQKCPGAMAGFMKLHHESLKPGALSQKDKELIALGIGIAVHCTGCITCHVKAAIDAGATREELNEVIGVAILMAGGPGSYYGSIAMKAIDEFLA